MIVSIALYNTLMSKKAQTHCLNQRWPYGTIESNEI